MTAPDLHIDVFSDISCPWCFIGTRRLESVLADLPDHQRVIVRHHPYQLHPDAPAGGIDLPAMLRERYGADPTTMFARVEEAAAGAGIALDLSAQPRAYDTAAAHTLIRHAGEKGTQRALVDALFVAYFVGARDISDIAVLSDVAERHGFACDETQRLVTDPDELAYTRHEARVAATSGVRGVPLFIFNDKLAISGAQPAHAFRRAIASASAPLDSTTDAGATAPATTVS
ncbi:MAG TPA: DsbA family oxidoreductase [Gemmatimonadaceae bacterium]|nr:DsbA family oxidoreductase [Gemmatimonadaceae bacterium]